MTRIGLASTHKAVKNLFQAKRKTNSMIRKDKEHAKKLLQDANNKKLTEKKVTYADSNKVQPA